jgi:ABC-type sulfate transport system permease component
LVGWLVGDHLLLGNFGAYGIIFMYARVGIIVAMAKLLSDLGLM